MAKAYANNEKGPRNGEEILVAWTYPPVDWFKLNTDGAVKRNLGIAGCGGVLRDSCGSWIAGFGANLGIATVTEAELWGLYHGLQMAWNVGCKKIIVEMDSLIVLQLMQKDLMETHPLKVLIVCCQQFLQRDWIVKFQHVYREGNRVADKLANWSLQQGIGTHKLQNPPQDCTTLLWEDCLGVTLPRWTLR